MKIGILLPSLNDGGVQKVVLNLYTQFKKENINTKLLVGDATGNLAGKFDKNDIIDYKKRKLNGDYKILFSLFKVIKSINKENFQLIVGVPGFSTIILIIANFFSKKKIKTILMVDNTISLLKKGKIKHKLSYFIYKYLYKYADKIIVAHDVGRNDIIASFRLNPQNVCRIYHPLIDLKDVDSSKIPTHYFINDNNYVIFSAGRMCQEKDFSNLIGAFSMFIKEVSNAKLIIAGDGEEKEVIVKKIKENNLENDVSLVGFTDNVLGFMKAADMYVLSSKQEAFGIVLVEALACGPIIVSTNCESGAQKEILLSGKHGYLCKIKSENELYKSMLEAYKKKNNYKKINYERAKDFSIEKSVSEYVKIFKEVLK